MPLALRHRSYFCTSQAWNMSLYTRQPHAYRQSNTIEISTHNMDTPDPADIFAKAGSGNNQSTKFEGAMPLLTYKRVMFIQDKQGFQDECRQGTIYHLAYPCPNHLCTIASNDRRLALQAHPVRFARWCKVPNIEARYSYHTISNVSLGR